MIWLAFSFIAGMAAQWALSRQRVRKAEADVFELLNARHSIELSLDDRIRRSEGQ